MDLTSPPGSYDTNQLAPLHRHSETQIPPSELALTTSVVTNHSSPPQPTPIPAVLEIDLNTISSLDEAKLHIAQLVEYTNYLQQLLLNCTYQHTMVNHLYHQEVERSLTQQSLYQTMASHFTALQYELHNDFEHHVELAKSLTEKKMHIATLHRDNQLLRAEVRKLHSISDLQLVKSKQNPRNVNKRKAKNDLDEDGISFTWSAAPRPYPPIHTPVNPNSANNCATAVSTLQKDTQFEYEATIRRQSEQIHQLQKQLWLSSNSNQNSTQVTFNGQTRGFDEAPRNQHQSHPSQHFFKQSNNNPQLSSQSMKLIDTPPHPHPHPQQQQQQQQQQQHSNSTSSRSFPDPQQHQNASFPTTITIPTTTTTSDDMQDQQESASIVIDEDGDVLSSLGSLSDSQYQQSDFGEDKLGKLDHRPAQRSSGGINPLKHRPSQQQLNQQSTQHEDNENDLTDDPHSQTILPPGFIPKSFSNDHELASNSSSSQQFDLNAMQQTKRARSNRNTQTLANDSFVQLDPLLSTDQVEQQNDDLAGRATRRMTRNGTSSQQPTPQESPLSSRRSRRF